MGGARSHRAVSILVLIRNKRLCLRGLLATSRGNRVANDLRGTQVTETSPRKPIS